VSRFGDQELYVSVRYVPGQVLVSAGVVQSHQGRPEEPGTAEGEHVIRGVVQEHGDVWRPTPVQTRTVQSGESFGLTEKIGVSPDLVAEAQDRSVGRGRVAAVSSEEGGHIWRRQGHLAERRGEDERFRHGDRLQRPTPWYLAIA
jgi:hypothetical protein